MVGHVMCQQSQAFRNILGVKQLAVVQNVAMLGLAITRKDPRGKYI
jgi:hypothetical protein